MIGLLVVGMGDSREAVDPIFGANPMVDGDNRVKSHNKPIAYGPC